MRYERDEGVKKDKMEDELRAEYNLADLRVRKIGPGRKSFGNIVRLDPDVLQAFPDADTVNEALRSLIAIAKRSSLSAS